jgi:Zn-dependent protease with chaperone function
MAFLNWPPLEQILPSPRVQAHRQRVISDLFKRFSISFPQITYELYWESRSPNAQAWRLGSTRYVRVYGGLVRHPALTKYGLALMLAHETGHHLGGPPYDPAMPWISWQGQADFWAASVAMPLVFGPNARRTTLLGMRELLIFQAEIVKQMDGDEPDLSPRCRDLIFRAGASNLEMPCCAKQEFSKCYGCDYPA